jgi:hypothetical protein
MSDAKPFDGQCCWCGLKAKDVEWFIAHPEISGLCDSCVGYLMSFLAIDKRDTFEKFVDIARSYSENNREMTLIKMSRALNS